jgi:hypothetical protein
VNQYYTFGEGLYMLVTNNNPQTINLTNSHTNWNEMSVAHNVDQLQYDWVQYYPGDDFDSPTNRGPADPSSFPHPPGVSKYWAAGFNNTPGGKLIGDFDTTLTFDLVCLISSSITIPTPTITPTTTNTPTPTQTFTPTTTPLPTSTPTITPTPSCVGVSFGSTTFDNYVSFGSTTFDNYARLRLAINNTTYPGLRITGITINWGPLQAASDLYSWSERVDWVQWNGGNVYSGPDYSSTTSFGLDRTVNLGAGVNNIYIDWDGGFEGSFKRSLTGNIPNPDAHTGANEHTNSDEYANGDANSDDYAFADGDKHTTADDSGSNLNASDSDCNSDNATYGLMRIERKPAPRERGRCFIPFLLRLINWHTIPSDG